MPYSNEMAYGWLAALAGRGVVNMTVIKYVFALRFSWYCCFSSCYRLASEMRKMQMLLSAAERQLENIRKRGRNLSRRAPHSLPAGKALDVSLERLPALAAQKEGGSDCKHQRGQISPNFTVACSNMARTPCYRSSTVKFGASQLLQQVNAHIMLAFSRAHITL